jgi:hypothetical protein
MRERREAIISNPNLPLEEKAQAVFEAAEDALWQAESIDRKLRPEEIYGVTKWLLNSEPVISISNREIDINKLEGKDFVDKIYNYFKNNGQLQVERGDWKVDVTKRGIRASRKKGLGASKIDAFAAVPEVIKSGRIVDFNPNWKGKGYDSYIIDAPIRIGAKDFICEIVVDHFKNGNYSFYVHEVEEKSKLLGVSQSGMDTATPEGASK